MSKYLCVFLFFCAAWGITQEKNNIPSIVASLDRLQADNGGVRASLGEEASLEATYSSLFLSSLLGVKDKVNSAGVTKYLQSLANTDHGYGKTSGLASDIESVRQVLLAYKHLGSEVPNPTGVSNFIDSLYDSKTGLYSNRVGDKGSLKATAFALQAQQLLPSKKALKSETKTLLNKYLQNGAKDNHFSFGGSPASDNYYGIYVGSVIGFEFGDATKWASYIASQQSTDGGFYSDPVKKTTSLEASLHSVVALNVLEVHSKRKDLAAKVDFDKLFSYARSKATDVKSAAQATLLVSLTKNFSQQFRTVATLQSELGEVHGDIIVEGTTVRSEVSVISSADLPHTGLTVGLTITHAEDSQPFTTTLAWDAQRRLYVAKDSYATANKLGAVTFKYEFKWNVPEIGEAVFTITSSKSIGYALTIASRAQLAGKEIPEGDNIAIGTDLSFGVTVQNKAVDSMTSGDFDLIFTVLDSSEVVVFSQKIDARKNNKPFTFAYTIKGGGIVGGELTARFEVANSKGVHTRKSVAYNLAIPMVATEINLQGATGKVATYKLGDKFTVSIVPAISPDLHSVTPISHTDANGKDVLAQRNFFLQVKTSSGVVKKTVKGTATVQSGKATYTFTDTIAASVDAIGSNVLSFVYKQANGKEISLFNYDSANQELFDESTALSYNVNAQLQLVEVEEQPKQDDYHYGNDIVFKFKLQDTVSKAKVVTLNPELANVYLSLKHQQSGKSRAVTSNNQPADIVRDSNGNPTGFVIRWSINANAKKGAGFLTLTVQDVDGVSTPIYSNNQPVQMNVNIGGEIVPQYKTFVFDTLDGKESVFIAEFKLLCQNKDLKNAQLRAVVEFSEDSYSSVEVAQVPVAVSDDGKYEVSWSVPTQQSKAGDYIVKVYREADRSRSQEDKEEVAPLFQLSISHLGKPPGSFALKGEFLVTFALALAFAWISMRKYNY